MPAADADSDNISTAGPPDERPAGAITGLGVTSAVLALVAVAAAALISVLWSGHRSAEADRDYQAGVMQAAAEWTGILININTDNVEASMVRLRDGTVGELNTGFEKSIAPYREVVKTLRSTTTGDVESVSMEVIHQDLNTQPGQRPPAPPALPEELASRMVAWLSPYENQNPTLCYDFAGDWFLFSKALSDKVPIWLTPQNIYEQIDPLACEIYLQANRLPQHHALYDARANRQPLLCVLLPVQQDADTYVGV
jgi:hypothetical protein